MAQTPTKDKGSQKEDRDNIFLAILYNVIVQTPVMIIAWIISQFDSD